MFLSCHSSPFSLFAIPIATKRGMSQVSCNRKINARMARLTIMESLLKVLAIRVAAAESS